MGKIITIKTDKIKPSQDFVKEGTVGYILECIVKKELDKLPPTPIVRANPDDSGYIAIDGHNLIVIYDLLDKQIEVYVADSSDDRLIELPRSTSDATTKRNQDLKDKYDNVRGMTKALSLRGISSFKDLRVKYPYLSDFKSAIKHYHLE